MKNAMSPAEVISFFILLFLGLTGGTITLALGCNVIWLNENQILYLFSTSSQVLASIYGLTLTGFIFLRNELSREEFEDETLTDAIENLKNRYFVLLVFITILVIFTILIANLAISYEGSGKTHINRLIINTGQSAFVTSLLAVSYFIFDVTSPKRIELASQTLQNKFDPTLALQTKGSLEEFLKNYNQIEWLLAKAGRPYQEISPNITEKRQLRRLSNSRLAEILLRSERIDKLLYQRLRELITLRNSIIHGADPVVSQAIVEASGDVRQKLQAALFEIEGDES